MPEEDLDADEREPWYGAFVPRYVWEGDSFCMVVNTGDVRFQLRVTCPPGAGAGSKVAFHRSDGL